MSKPLLPLALLLSLAPVLRASPPEGPSGEMVLDEVTEKLLLLRLESDSARKLALVKQLGPVRDARVTVALMEVVLAEDRQTPLLVQASAMLVYHHIPEKDHLPAKYWTVCRLWWEANEAGVRRRAKQLP